MNDRQTFAALCAQPRSILCPKNSDSALCCDDVLDLIRVHVCPPQMWAVDYMRKKLAAYNMGLRQWAAELPIQDAYFAAAAPISGRGWLLDRCDVRGHDICFLEPGKPLIDVPFTESPTPLSCLAHVNNHVVAMSQTKWPVDVMIIQADLDNLVSIKPRSRRCTLMTRRRPLPLAVVPCGSGALLACHTDYVPTFFYLDVYTAEASTPTSACPIKNYHSGLKAMSVEAGVEFWAARGPVALYDLRERNWQSYPPESISGSSQILRSVAAVDQNLVACAVNEDDVIGSIMRFYDRRAMALVPSRFSDLRNINADSLVCL